MRVLILHLDNDSAVLQRLRKRFPEIGFKKHSKNEELEEEGPDILAIDNVMGINSVTLFENLNEISPGRALKGSEMVMTMRILVSIGSLKSVRLIAVPPGYDADSAFEEICRIIEGL